MSYYQKKVDVADAEIKLAKVAYLPKFSIEYGLQKIGNTDGFYKYQIGVSIPLFFASQMGKMQSAKINSNIARENFQLEKLVFNASYKSLYKEYQKWLSTTKYYQDVALPVAKEQKLGAITAYKEGAINYITFLQNMKDAMQIEFDYQDAYSNYLKTQFEIEYYLNISK